MFAFALSCAGMEIGQFLSMVIAPSGIADYGAQNYHLVTGTVDHEEADCDPTCPFTALVGRGDRAGFDPTGHHQAAAESCAARAAHERQPRIRLRRRLERLIKSVQRA